MTIYIVDLEPVETRYTGQWKSHVPQLLLDQTIHNISIIEGPGDIPEATTPGAFLNFGGTNVYKAAQVEKIGRMFCDGSIKDGDHFLFTDAWHPGIINLKYMSKLLGVKIATHGLWHAGSYDPQDFLGRLIGDEPWVRYAEMSFFEAFDHNYFATDFHIRMFADVLLPSLSITEHYKDNKKIVQTGWPMEYMSKLLDGFKNNPKRDTILFPHRLAPEKQVEIFKDLAQYMPQYEFIVCQEEELTKDEYHILLSQSKMVFSCSLQETLGITTGAEGPLLGVMPLVPDRLSYIEIFQDHPTFKYPSEWTDNWDNYVGNRELLIEKINSMMLAYDDIVPIVRDYIGNNYKSYFHAGQLIKQLS